MRQRSILLKASLLVLGFGVAGIATHVAISPISASSTIESFNEVLSIGDDAPKLTGLIQTDGKPFDAEEIAKGHILIIVFTCNTCPYAVDYEQRLVEMHHSLVEEKKPVTLIAINSNDVAGDSLEAMEKRVRDKSISFAYLKDIDQSVAKAFGAGRTPECYVIAGNGKVAYMGAFDDNTDPKKVTKHYVNDAIENLLANQEVTVTESAPVGCRIRFKQRRR